MVSDRGGFFSVTQVQMQLEHYSPRKAYFPVPTKRKLARNDTFCSSPVEDTLCNSLACFQIANPARNGLAGATLGDSTPCDFSLLSSVEFYVPSCSTAELMLISEDEEENLLNP